MLLGVSILCFYHFVLFTLIVNNKIKYIKKVYILKKMLIFPSNIKYLITQVVCKHLVATGCLYFKWCIVILVISISFVHDYIFTKWKLQVCHSLLIDFIECKPSVDCCLVSFYRQFR